MVLKKGPVLSLQVKLSIMRQAFAKLMILTGTAVSVKARGKATAEIVKVINVNINRHRCYLLPGMQKIHRRVTVRGQDINDVPTKYTMTGLEPYEIPVVGTYIDPKSHSRILLQGQTKR
ncbi:hypothetical protein NQ317_004501 [Molorchus minor]|uniref:Uncharacterized protein n=1 Tax=Molorchus minor TaxID=1323400 RepID=A0ABQ9J940_9CUCU|nr:hypothetical protein NQ317_004501 [Molorchus minor]